MCRHLREVLQRQRVSVVILSASLVSFPCRIRTQEGLLSMYGKAAVSIQYQSIYVYVLSLSQSSFLLLRVLYTSNRQIPVSGKLPGDFSNASAYLSVIVSYLFPFILPGFLCVYSLQSVSAYGWMCEANPPVDKQLSTPSISSTLHLCRTYLSIPAYCFCKDLYL